MLRLVVLFIVLVAVFVLSCLAESLSIHKRALSPPDNDNDNHSHYHPTSGNINVGSGGEDDNDLKLLDIVLVASVDGKFHALNRSSGHTLWSMSSTFPASAPSTLGPLVRTNHLNTDTNGLDNDDEEDALNQELYIIEPQSGDIYVMATPSGPLQRLAFSMSQLVDMSPFSFSSIDDSDINGERDRRVFVGRKETSLFSIELETGRVKEVNSECPWDPFEDLSLSKQNVDVNLDDLEGGSDPVKPIVPVSTEISIGRTDYHITIHTRPSNPSQPKPPVQNLSFSTYGPNNRDSTVQAIYRRSADDAYVQSFPNGDVFAFRTPRDTSNNTPPTEAERPIDPLWMNKFSMPIVAVFDVVQKKQKASSTRGGAHSDPFVLLQPHPRLSNSNSNDLLNNLPNAEKAYVGLVEESGSLFAMSPTHFPLVAFGGDVSEEYEYEWLGEGDVGKGVSSPFDVDAITARRKMREMCGRKGGRDRRCLIGRRPLVVAESGKEEEGQSREWKSLLDGVPSVGLPPSPAAVGAGGDMGMGRMVDASLQQLTGVEVGKNVTWIRGGNDSTLMNSVNMGMDSGRTTTTAMYYGSTVLFVLASWGLLAFFVGAVQVYKKVRGGGLRGVRSIVGGELESKAVGDALGEYVSVVENIDDVTAPAPIRGPARLGSSSPASISGSYVFMEAEAEAGLEADAGDVDVEVSSNNNKLPNGKDAATSGLGTTVTDDVGDAEDSERDGDADAAGKRKGPKKKRRGKKKKASAAAGAGVGVNGGQGMEDGEKEENVPAEVADAPPAGLVVPSTPKKTESATSPSLVVSDTILGFGSHGTVVFKGSLQGRAVAVKRLLQDFVTLASREVSILQESDDHPNVIRYYYQEAHANFLYIALELCPASLADIIETPDQFRDISNTFDPKRALRQIASGLRHLHSLKLIHRDIKPQNILVSGAKKQNNKSGGRDGGHRMLISDFGLCKKLDVDQTSFLPTAHGAMAAGTVGWRAPEILRGEVKLDESVGGDESQSSRGSVGTPTNGSGTFIGKPTRLTKLVDIFALGCLFYYTLTSGGHPYGDRFEREVNILKNVKSLEGLERFGEEGSDAAELISLMLSTDASDRPDTTSCLLHPFFWDHGRRLTFLQDASDRFEIMCRDPRDPHLVTLEKGAFDIVGNDWHSRLDKVFIENLGKFRKYDGKSVQDLLRALRNKKNHYQDLPDNVKRHLGPMPEGFLSYFTRRYPRLFLHVHSVIANTSLRQESMFRSYFELAE